MHEKEVTQQHSPFLNLIAVLNITFNRGLLKKDAIKCLFDTAGDRIYGQKSILNECRKYYQFLYSQPDMPLNPVVRNKFLSRIPKHALSERGKTLLGKEISQEELYLALKDMKRESVCGEDGLSVDFYLTFWDEIKDLLYASYCYAYDTRHMSITQRRGIICLLPKQARNPLYVSSWRPITLLNVDFKIVTKLFSKRLEKFLPDLIHEDQRGFIKNRSIHENILDVHAVISACENLDNEGMLILLDIEKAFDSLGWNFLRDVLIQYQFPQYFVEWFEIFYTGKELHVMNDGHLSEVIFPAQGLAQGCGSSPLFFVLAIEVLALAIRENELIEGFKLMV